jgi:hypothetical protein
VTEEHRLEQLALATTLGRLFLLWGVVEGTNGTLECECGGRPNCRPGKHPRPGAAKSATTDLRQIETWLVLYPHANFGIVMGEHVVAVDADVRPTEGKHGAAVIEYLEIQSGKRIPDTVKVVSGRNNGSYHLFFNLEGLHLDALRSPFYGVDLMKRGHVVAPGSRHVSGAYYAFDDESDPVSVALASMPDLLLREFTPKTMPTFTAVTPGRLRPDFIVERQIRRDPIAGPLFAGKRVTRKGDGTYDRSRDDFSLCKYLAFYCSHHLDQAHRLFQKSGLFGAKDEPGYIDRTMAKAFEANSSNWVQKKRPSRATGAKLGRRFSEDTIRIVSIHQNEPELKPIEISKLSGCSPEKVRNVLCRLRSGRYEPYHNTDSLHTGGITGPIAVAEAVGPKGRILQSSPKAVPTGTQDSKLVAA